MYKSGSRAVQARFGGKVGLGVVLGRFGGSSGGLLKSVSLLNMFYKSRFVLVFLVSSGSCTKGTVGNRSS